MIEFNLSEKEHGDYTDDGYYFRKDVKEFIIKDTDLIFEFNLGTINFNELLEKRNKLLGEKLK